MIDHNTNDMTIIVCVDKSDECCRFVCNLIEGRAFIGEVSR